MSLTSAYSIRTAQSVSDSVPFPMQSDMANSTFSAMQEPHDSPIMVPAPILAGDFAGWLKEAMAARGVSQRMLGHISGIDHSTISRLLAGDREPTLGTALALIRVLERPGRRPRTVPKPATAHEPTEFV